MATNNTPVGSLKVNSGGGNSSPKDKPRREKRPPVATATVTKKSLGEKFSDAFVKEDLKSVGLYLVKEKIFPDFISMLRDSIWDGITMHFGLGGIRKDYGSGRPGYTNYQAASNTSSYNYTGKKVDGEPKKTQIEGPDDFRELSYDSEKEAKDVLYSMAHYAREYERGAASVAELYESSNRTWKRFTDDNWGWPTEVLESNLPIRRVMRDGQLKYIIEFPDPIPIN